MNKIKHFYLPPLLGCLLGFLSCASERSITGGPTDETAPQIVASDPVSGSLSIDTSTDIYIKFSEQMNKSSLRSALQIWPRPTGGYELKAGWTWLRVVFNEPLEPDETYLLTLNKTAKDLRGNALDAIYVMAFSTGEEMNRGKIRGKIFGNSQVKQSGNIMLFKELETNLEDLTAATADYIFQPDDDGNFELNYLNNQRYLLYYHWDRNRNRIIDTHDYFGRPLSSTVFARTDSLIAVQGIWPRPVASDRVKLLEVSRLYDQMYQLRTDLLYSNETLDSIQLFSDGVQVPILGATRVNEDKVAMHIMLKDTLPDSSLMWISGFVDTSGYQLQSDSLVLQNEAILDSLYMNPLKISWSNGQLEKFPDDSNTVVLKANVPFTVLADSAFMLYSETNDSTAISGTFEQQGAMKWEFKPGLEIEDGTQYKWKILTQFIDSKLKGNDMDSLYSGKLRTVNEDSLGSIRLSHRGPDVLICQLIAKKVFREFELTPGDQIVLENLPATNYTIFAYVDQNLNGKYDTGAMDPKIGSEPFWNYPEQIKVRARWETDIGVWRLE